MKTLCLDTSHKFLVVGLLEDGKVVQSYQEECWKKQSEMILPVIDKLCKKANWKPLEIDEIVISKGPGSYTGVRIAMTIAKVICSMRSIPLYTLSTLQLYAGTLENIVVVLDARSNRVYYGEFNKGISTIDESILTIDNAKNSSLNKLVIGDAELVNQAQQYPDIVLNFLLLKKQWKRIENIHTVLPEYLKSNEEYMTK